MWSGLLVESRLGRKCSFVPLLSVSLWAFCFDSCSGRTHRRDDLHPDSDC